MFSMYVKHFTSRKINIIPGSRARSRRRILALRSAPFVNRDIVAVSPTSQVNNA
jgi:hypothetical protein